ncbi:hypothetical protein N7478_006422 [Penicillium angulare]|uniref:uncharacterized protein n=1 Tax=Penicillium angulare TaxID=116970 RepID=UPI002541E369|nr:uncharacterized protein N7478_006422 [Penicillium angulare]KAJ5281050.1 hypothetical protein N7478_006422 [Penicillium angulare]
MKLLLAFCALAAATFIPNKEHNSPHIVTILFAEEKSGRNFPVNIPADQRTYNVHNLFHGIHQGVPLFATSAQLTSSLSQGTTCVISFDGKKIATLSTEHSFAWLHEQGPRHSPVNIDHATIICRA